MQQYCHKRRLSNPGEPFFSSFSISTKGGYLPLFTDITTHHLIEQRLRFCYIYNYIHVWVHVMNYPV